MNSEERCVVLDATKQAIERLYLTFNTYEIGNPETISCFDFGPSIEELSGLSKDLRNIPDSTLAGMEFFEYGWDSWGTKNEVGYFLPRLMEYLANDAEKLENPGLFSLFKYKLRDLFSDTNHDWTHDEKESLSEFMTAFLLERLSVDNDVGMLIECALALNLDSQHILSNWKSDEQLHIKQVVTLFEHFNCPAYGKSTPEGVYFDNSARIQVFLDLLFEQLTPEEIAEIS
jgi:hypothetical protein